MIGIVVALKKEAQYFIEKLDEKTEFSLIGKPFVKGKISDKEIVLCICGIGKVNSAMATQLIINEFAPTAILNFGTAGGFSEQVSPLKYYAIDKCFQADFDLSELDGVPVGYMQDYDRLFYQVNTTNLDFLDKKSLASADRFSDKTEFIELLKSNGVALRDMEGCAIAQVCLANSVPFYSIKGVSDVYGSGASGKQFMENLSAVCRGFADIIEKTIVSIL